jgi:hypothetical protein
MSITHSAAIASVAEQCSLWRAKKKCIAKFNAAATIETPNSLCCNACPNHIGKYLAASPNDMELFMFQTDKDVREQLWEDRHHINMGWLAVLIPLLFIYGCLWVLSNPGPNVKVFAPGQKLLHPIKWSRHNAIVSEPYTPVVQPKTMTTHQMIEFTLYKVAKDWDKKIDVNSDGKTNCVDAAVLFYQYWPDKEDVCIEVNDKIMHAFNCVIVNGVWRAIEPQAYRNDRAWASQHIYYMRDVWGSEYDSSLNKDGWHLYGKYVK